MPDKKDDEKDWMDWAHQGLNVVGQVVKQKQAKYTHTKDQLTKRERMGINFAAQSYKLPGKRKYKLHGYTYQPDLSNEKSAVYKNKNGNYQVAFAGTKPGYKTTQKEGDLLQDVQIAKGENPTIQINQAKEVIQAIMAQDPNSKGKISLNSHSLSGRVNLNLLHDNPEWYRDSVSIAPGFSPLTNSAQSKRDKELITGNPKKNRILVMANDGVWSSKVDEMFDSAEKNGNVKILKAEDETMKGMATNHFLASYQQRDSAHVRMRKLLKEHGFSNNDIERHANNVQKMDDDEGHALVDRTEKQLAEGLAGSLKSKPAQYTRHPRAAHRESPYDYGYHIYPPWHKKKRSTILAR